MSGNLFEGVVLPENIIRDFLFTVVNGGNFAYDCPITGRAIGLDIFLNNQGAAAITLSINGQPPITIPAGAMYAMSSTKWWLIAIVAAVNYDLQVSGVRITTLMKKGLIDAV